MSQFEMFVNVIVENIDKTNNIDKGILTKSNNVTDIERVWITHHIKKKIAEEYQINYIQH